MESLRYKGDESAASPSRSQEDLGRTSSHGELSKVERSPSPAQVQPSAPQLNAAVPASSWNIIAWSRLIFGSSLKVKERFLSGVSQVSSSVENLCKYLLIAAVRRARAHPRALASVKKVVSLFPKIDARMRETVEEHDKLEMRAAETAQHSQTASLPAAISSSDEEPKGREHEKPLFRHDLESTSEFCASEIDWTAHPESVHRIYEDLKKAVENHRP